MPNYDDDFLGVNNSMHPANEIEVDAEIVETYNNLTEAYESGHVEVFEEMQSKAVQKQKDLIYALESVDSGLTGMAKEILKLIS
jgi:phosphate uptake regulator